MEQHKRGDKKASTPPCPLITEQILTGIAPTFAYFRYQYFMIIIKLQK